MNKKAVLFLLISLLLVFSGCRERRGIVAIAAVPQEPIVLTGQGPAWQALALLRTGENPIWFELGPNGPLHIVSPAAAALTSFEPWPHARFITQMLHWDGFLVMLVNRDGFLVMALSNGDNEGELLLYQITNRGFWNNYTAESLIIWDDKPAALLYRNDFFSQPISPSPKPQVFALDFSSPAPLGISIPAFENIPQGWEAELVHKGPDDYWYFRIRDKEADEAETQYFRSRDLGEGAERIAIEEWRNSYGLNELDLDSFTLPALDEGFVYTGVTMLENVLIASWEEQQDAGIGAAGFMLVGRQ